jgi:ribosomal protein S18 acetylase RimI-like enzyme
MSQAIISVHDVSPADLGTTLQWLFPHLTIDRAQWMLGQLTERVQSKRMAEIIVIEARADDELVSAAVAVLQPAKAASLLAIHALGTSKAAENAVLSHLRSQLAGRGVQFLQATSDSPPTDRRLIRLGFKHLAELAVLVLESEKLASLDCEADSTLQFLPATNDPAMIDRIAQTAELSFTETCDCPALNEFRTPTEIVDGYRLSPQFDSHFWRLATLGNKPAGCLILTAHRAEQPPPIEREKAAVGAIEISYMGLVPQYRKRGLGRALLIEAVKIAKQHHASRMVLAVDRENSPAIALYQRQGWTEAAKESVWGMQILP